MPEIDVLLMSHDHWDHLDYPTIMALKDKVKVVVCPLGVGAYFEQWGFDMSKVHEADWQAFKAKSDIMVQLCTDNTS